MEDIAHGLAALAPLALFGVVSWFFPTVGFVWLGVFLVWMVGALTSDT